MDEDIVDIKANMIARIEEKAQIVAEAKAKVSTLETWVKSQGENITKIDQMGENQVTFILINIKGIGPLLDLAFSKVLIEQGSDTTGRITITL